MAARFITFEGLDGSGKSTHIARVAARLAGADVPHLLTHEPGGTPLGHAIRNIFLDRKWSGLDGVSEALLMFASRRQHLLDVIDPALAEGRHVLCDRFTDSTLVYQGFGRGVELDDLRALDRIVTGGRVPDRTLLFDLPPEEARRRAGAADRLDDESLAFYSKVREGFLALAAEAPERYRVIDSSGGAEATAEMVRNALGAFSVDLESTLEIARRGRLYPSVILHGGSDEERRAAAFQFARLVLCTAEPSDRPCGTCRHCSRIGDDSVRGPEAFHPDVAVLERDTKTTTSVAAARAWVAGAQVRPFEARGQVFIVAAAETLSDEGANALLKSLEEPHLTAPRHFLLLAPSQFDLLPTLRSRSLAVFLPPSPRPSGEAIDDVAERFAGAVNRFDETAAGVYLLAAAGVLEEGADYRDPRAGTPWSTASSAVLASLPHVGEAWRRPLLALAEELLAAPDLRVRGITAPRILEGLVAKHLAGR